MRLAPILFASGNAAFTPPVIPGAAFTESASGTGIPAGDQTITDATGAVWKIRLSDRTVLKDYVAQAATNALELWYVSGKVWAFYGDSYEALTAGAVGTRPVMPTTAGLRLPVGPQLLTSYTGVQIAAGTNIQTVVNANAAGTTYVLGIGTHVQQAVVPKAGDVFVGLFNGTTGAVMDGEDTAVYAFHGAVTTDYVTVRNLVIKRYTAPTQFCTVQLAGAYALVQNCDVSLATQGGGIWVGRYGLAIANDMHANAQLGYKAVGNETDGVTVLAGCCFDSNEIRSNNPSAASWGGSEQGGGKSWNSTNLTFWYNYSHDNIGPGLWTDLNNLDTRYHANKCTDNAASGIEHEISYNAEITYNELTNNGSASSVSGFFAGAGIAIENSGGITSGTYAGTIEIAYNTITAGTYGRLIACREQDRGGLPSPYSSDIWQLQNMYVHHNTFTVGALVDPQMGIARDVVVAPDIYTARAITWDYNTYTTTTGLYFSWGDYPWYTYADWQDTFGMDLNGTPAPPSQAWSTTAKNASIVLSGADLVATGSGAGGVNFPGRATRSFNAGNVFWKITATTQATGGCGVGICNGSHTFTDDQYLGLGGNSIGWYPDGSVYYGSALLGTVGSFVAGDVLSIACQGGGSGKIWLGVNGVYTGNPAAGTGGLSQALVTVFPAYNLRNTDAVTAVFAGATGAPTGFSPFSGSGTDSDATAWKAAVVSAGGTVSDTQLGYVSTLITALKAAGVWTLLDRLSLYASENAFQALVDVKSLTTAMAVGAPTFTANRKYAFAGASHQYINTGFNASTATNFLQNSAHYAFYCGAASSGDGALFGPVTASSGGLNIYNTGGGLYLRLNDNPETNAIGVPGDMVGFFAGNRSGATARQAYMNGAALGSYGSQTSQAVLNDNLAVGAWVPSGSWTTTSQFSAFSAGGSLTSGQHADYYTAIQAYMTSVGANV